MGLEGCAVERGETRQFGRFGPKFPDGTLEWARIELHGPARSQNEGTECRQRRVTTAALVFRYVPVEGKEKGVWNGAENRPNPAVATRWRTVFRGGRRRRPGRRTFSGRATATEAAERTQRRSQKQRPPWRLRAAGRAGRPAARRCRLGCRAGGNGRRSADALSRFSEGCAVITPLRPSRRGAAAAAAAAAEAEGGSLSAHRCRLEAISVSLALPACGTPPHVCERDSATRRCLRRRSQPAQRFRTERALVALSLSHSLVVP